MLGLSRHIEARTYEGRPVLYGSYEQGLGLAEVRVNSYTMEEGLVDLPLSGTDALEQISVGYVRGDMFYAYDNAGRSKLTPALPASMELPVLEGKPAVLTVDILGRRLVHILEGDKGEQI